MAQGSLLSVLIGADLVSARDTLSAVVAGLVLMGLGAIGAILRGVRGYLHRRDLAIWRHESNFDKLQTPAREYWGVDIELADKG